MDTVDLATVFSFGEYYGEGHRENMDLLLEALQTGAVTVQVLALPAVDWAAWDARRLGMFSGQTSAHQVLCAIAADWLEGQGQPWSAAAKDLAYAGGKAAVATLDGRLFIECGYTRAGKVLDALAQGLDVLVIPYAEDVTGYLFQAVDPAQARALAERPLREYMAARAADLLHVPYHGRPDLGGD